MLVNAFSDDNRGESITPLVPGLIIMAVYYFMISVVKSNFLFYYSILNVRMTGALSMKIFEKTMSLAIFRNQNYKVGDILNMVQVDILQVVGYTQSLISLICFFPLIVISVIIVEFTLKDMSIVAVMVATSIFFFVVAVFFGRIYGSLQKQFMHLKDLRMRGLDEMMRGIKTIKYNIYETFFDERIKSKRSSEVSKLRILNFLTFFNTFIMESTNSLNLLILTFIFGITSFKEFILIRSSQSIIIGFIQLLPPQIQAFIVGSNSLYRLNLFFKESFVYQRMLPMPNSSSIDRNEKQPLIQLRNAQFYWSNSIIDNPTQKQAQEKNSSVESAFSTNKLNLSIMEGEFVVFFGNLGSGKSTILQGILGETYVPSDQPGFQESVIVNGTLSICTQEPWILQDSVKQNILFQQNFNSERYEQTLEACCLKEDIEYLNDGDETVVGEKGETLSGGQRKRINLARSVYQESDIYFLDDPLSALDVVVANHVAEKCFNKLLFNKTRVVFASTLLGMQKSNRIFMIESGKLIKETTYSELALLKNSPCTSDLDQKEISQQEQISNLKKQVQEKGQIIINNKGQSSKNFITSESIQHGAINIRIFGFLIKLLGQKSFLFFLLLVMGAFVYITLYGRLLMTGVKSTDHPTLQEQEQAKEAILKYCLFDLLRVLIEFLIMGGLVILSMARVSESLHKKIVFKLLRGSFTKFYNLITTGRLMNRLSKDIYEVDLLLPSDIHLMLRLLGKIIAMTSVTIVLFNIRIAPIVIIYLFLSIYISIYFLRAKRQIVRIEAVSKSPILQYLSEMIRGIFYVRNCANRQLLQDKFQELVEIDLQNQIALNGIEYWFELIANFLSFWPMALAFAIEYFDTETSSKDAIVIALAITNISMSLIQGSESWISFETHLVNFERCARLIRETPTEDYSPVSCEQQNGLIQRRSSCQSNLSDSPSPGKREEPSISFEMASFKYQLDQPDCLRDLSVQFSGKERIAIVGRTGAGKTSISLALTRFIDISSGNVIINGENISNYSLPKLRKTIGVVSQEPYIFEGTLQENMDPYNEYRADELLQVFKKCNLNQLKSFEKGLETKITQLGENLSEGEKQLISIARIILKKPKIVIVDEPTSRIDESMEQQVMKMIDTSFSDCLLITIAHRLKTIMGSDNILVLDHGKIIEFGTPSCLLENPDSHFTGIVKTIQDTTNAIN